MSNIIKQTDIVMATNGGHDGLRANDYITDKRYESFDVIDGIEERTYDGKHSVTFYNCMGVNPVTLKRDGEDMAMSESQLKEYYEAEHGVKQGDPIKTRGGDTMFYDGFVFDAFGSIVILCHAAKKDGTASKTIHHRYLSDF